MKRCYETLNDMARPKVHTDELRERLIADAVTVVARDGIGALSVREVAKAAGTSTSAVYSLFGNKEGLAREVLVHAFTSFATAQRTPSPDLGHSIDSMGFAYVEWALANPRLYDLMFGDALTGIEHDVRSRAAATAAIEPLRSAVRAAITDGVLRDAPIETVVASLWAQMHGMTTLLLAGHYPPDADPVAAAKAVVDGWRTPTDKPHHRNPPGTTVIRPAIPDDATELNAILSGIVAEGDKTAIADRLSDAEFAEWFITGRHCITCYVALRHDGAAVGFQTLERYHDDLPKATADIGTFVAPGARTSGIGRLLTAATVDAAKRAALSGIRAVVRDGNTEAQLFYRSMGFEASGTGKAAGSVTMLHILR